MIEPQPFCMKNRSSYVRGCFCIDCTNAATEYKRQWRRVRGILKAARERKVIKVYSHALTLTSRRENE